MWITSVGVCQVWHSSQSETRYARKRSTMYCTGGSTYLYIEETEGERDGMLKKYVGNGTFIRDLGAVL